MTAIIFSKAETGFPDSAKTGQTVSWTITDPAGSSVSLMQSTDLVTWTAVASPTVAGSGSVLNSGPQTTYMWQCTSYAGTPLTASFSIA